MTVMPYPPYRAAVAPEWIDYNGHMNVAYYVLAFDRATDLLLDHLGLGEVYRRASNHSLFVLEAHVTYARELRAGDHFEIETRLIDADRKRLHLFHRMTAGETALQAATIEVIALHVDLPGPRAAPLPDAPYAAIETLLAAHRQLPAPPELGHKIGIQPKSN